MSFVSFSGPGRRTERPVSHEAREYVAANEIARLDRVEVDHGEHAGFSSAADEAEEGFDRIWVEVPDWPNYDPVPIHENLDRWFGIRVITRPHHFAPPFAAPHGLAPSCALVGDRLVTGWNRPVDNSVRQRPCRTSMTAEAFITQGGFGARM